jgi:hypothetical protein
MSREENLTEADSSSMSQYEAKHQAFDMPADANHIEGSPTAEPESLN